MSNLKISYCDLTLCPGSLHLYRSKDDSLLDICSVACERRNTVYRINHTGLIRISDCQL